MQLTKAPLVPGAANFQGSFYFCRQQLHLHVWLPTKSFSYGLKNLLVDSLLATRLLGTFTATGGSILVLKLPRHVTFISHHQVIHTLIPSKTPSLTTLMETHTIPHRLLIKSNIWAGKSL